MKKLIFIPFLLFFLLIPDLVHIYALPDNNIIKNGEFEDKSVWVFSDWITPWAQEDRGYVLDANGYEGNCLKITSEASESFQQRISFPAGTSSNPLYFSFKYKIEGSDYYAVVLYVPENFGIWLIHDQKGYRIGKEFVEFSKMTILRHIDVGRGWKQVDVAVETSSGNFRPFRIYPNPAPNYLYIDDLYLGTEAPSPPSEELPPPPPSEEGPPSTGGGIHFGSPFELKCGDLPCIIEAIINFIFYGGIALLPLIIIIGGIMYATSGGDYERVSTAKRIIFWAVIGLIIILLAKAIISVIRSVLGGG